MPGYQLAQPRLVLVQLNELLTSKRQWKFDDDPNHIFGYEVYSNFARIVSSDIQEGKNVNIIPFLLLAEHKKLMRMRIEYLEKFGLLEDSREYANFFSDMEKKFITLRNKWLKYNFSKNKSAADGLAEQIEEAKEMEIQVLSKIVASLDE